MTATQLFLGFLKQTCTLREYMFFRNTILNDNGSKFFSKRKLYHDDFCEKYLERNHRALDNLMTRMFVLAPNLVKNCARNPRFHIIREKLEEHYEEVTGATPIFHLNAKPSYVAYYRRSWNKWLKENIISEKNFHSPFKKGETYDFQFKNNKDGQDSSI